MSTPFAVTCDDCAFEREASSREEALAVAQRHLEETDHDVFAVELPGPR